MVYLHPIRGTYEGDLRIIDDKDVEHIVNCGLRFDIIVSPSKTLQPMTINNKVIYPFEVIPTVKAVFANIPSDLKTYVSSFNYRCELLKATVIWLSYEDYQTAVQFRKTFIEETVVGEYLKYSAHVLDETDITED